MDLLYFLPAIVGFFCCVYISLLYDRKGTRRKLDAALFEIERLQHLPAPKKETLTVEAQQIVNDLTAHGQAIVRIIPISPTDIFWRSPR